jgi:hypothetical protein
MEMYDDGSALLEMTSDGMQMHMRVEEDGEPKDIDMQFTKDKLIVTTAEGTEEISLDQAGMGMGAPFGTPMRMRMTPRGEVVSFSGPGMEQLSQMMGTDLSQMMRPTETPFPEHALSPGDSWEYTMDFPIPGSDGKVTMEMKAELARVEEAAGSRIATIAVGGSIDMSGMTMDAPTPPDAPGVKLTFDTMTEEIGGEFDFDLDCGCMTRAAYDLDLAMEMDMPGGPDQPSPGTMHMEMQMSVEMKLQ